MTERRRAVIIRAAAWGRRYNAILRRDLLPCLAANLAEAAGQIDVTLDLYTDVLLSAAEMEAIKCRVVNRQLPAGLVPPEEAAAGAHRGLFTLTEWTSLVEAREKGAVWMSLGAETLLSSRFIIEAVRLIEAGNHAVLGTPLRTARGPFEAAFGLRRRFSAAELYDANVRFTHRDTIELFVTMPPQVARARPHQALFVDADPGVTGAVAVRPMQFGIYAIDTERLPRHLSPTKETVDCRLLMQLPRRLDGSPVRVHVERDPAAGALHLTTLDDETAVFDDCPVTMKELAWTALRLCGGRATTDRGYFAWALDQRVLFWPGRSGAAIEPPKRIVGEAAAVERIKAMIAAG